MSEAVEKEKRFLISHLSKQFVTNCDSDARKQAIDKVLVTLNSPAFASSSSPEESILTHQIKKKLDKSGKSGVGSRFSELAKELKKVSDSSPERASLLQFLYSLNEESKKSASTDNAKPPRYPVNTACASATISTITQRARPTQNSSKIPVSASFVKESPSGAAESNGTPGHFTMESTPSGSSLSGSSTARGKWSRTSTLKTSSQFRESHFTPLTFTPISEPITLSNGIPLERRGAGGRVDNASGSERGAVAIGSTPAAAKGRNHSPSGIVPKSTEVVPKRPVPFVEESLLVKDCLFLVQGIDGNYIRWDSRRDRIIVDSSINVSYGARQKLSRICEYFGWMFMQVKCFVDTHVMAKQPGMISAAFSCALDDFVGEYYGLIAGIANKGELTLSEFLVELYDWQHKMDLFCELVHVIKEDHLQGIGGRLLVQIFSFVHHGNPVFEEVARNLLAKLCLPLKMRIIAWMCDGILDDPHDEFFVSENPGVLDSEFWNKRYSIRDSMLPHCQELNLGIGPDIALKILTTGKAIIFLCSMCKEHGEEMYDLERNRKFLNEMKMDWIYDFAQFYKFESVIAQCHLHVSEHVLKALRTHHNLQQHFKAMYSYLLLTNGGFCIAFMELLHNEFEKNAQLEEMERWRLSFSGSRQHRLGMLLTTAIEQSNAVYEIQDVKDRLDIQILEFEDDEEDMWASVVLKYNLEGPISMLFTEDVMTKYSRLFDFFWRGKRLDFVMSRVVACLMHEVRVVAREMPETAGVIHKFQLVAVEMRSLEICMLAFFSEGIAGAWAKLLIQLEKVPDLDSLIVAHCDYLDNCLTGCLLDGNSVELQNILLTLWSIIHRFIDLYRKFSTECQRELDIRNEWRRLELRKTTRGQFAHPSNEGYLMERHSAVNSLVLEMNQSLKIVNDLYRASIMTLMIALCNQRSDKLRNLTLILDFNGCYEKLEPELEVNRRFSRISQIKK